MKKKINRAAFVLIVLLTSSLLSLSSEIEPIKLVYDWTEYETRDGIKIEYKYQSFESGVFRNQMLILFRYTNTTLDPKSISWSIKEFRDGVCSNCARIENLEYSYDIFLNSGEVIEGDGSDVTNVSLYLFSHFLNLSPGMTATRLTDFEFVNIKVLPKN